MNKPFKLALFSVITVLLAATFISKSSFAETEPLLISPEFISNSLMGPWEATITCDGATGPYSFGDYPFESTFLLNIWPRRSTFSAFLVISGTVCKYHEEASYTFMNNGKLTLASLGGDVILDPSSHASCPLPREIFTSLIDDLGFADTYTYVAQKNGITAVSDTDAYCSRYGQPGVKATLHLMRY